MGHHLVETDVLDSIKSTQLLSLQLRKNICEIPGFADVWWIFSMGDPPLVESLGNRNIWLVVWNILNFPFHIWENPSHWLSYCSRLFFNHQPDMHTFFYLRGFLDRISPPKNEMIWGLRNDRESNSGTMFKRWSSRRCLCGRSDGSERPWEFGKKWRFDRQFMVVKQIKKLIHGNIWEIWWVYPLVIQEFGTEHVHV